MTYMDREKERRLDIVDHAEAIERWQQLRAWRQPHSYPVPGVTADGTPCWTMWRWTRVVNAELAAEACRLCPGPPVAKPLNPQDPPDPPAPKEATPVKQGPIAPKQHQRSFF